MYKLSIILLSLFVSQALAQERVAIPVQTTPAGAKILLDGALVGVSPMTLSLSDQSGISKLEMRLYGYSTFELSLDYDELPEIVTTELELRRSRIPVTTPDDLVPAPDGLITLREAIEYASGASLPVGADAILIDGPVGADRPDDVQVQIAGYSSSPILQIDRPLPPLSGIGDTISGPEERAVIAQAYTADFRGAGLSLGAGTFAERLVVDGFDIGFEASGFGSMQVRDVAVYGGYIGFSAKDGASLYVNGATAAVEFASVSAVDGGIIEGFVEAIDLDDLSSAQIQSGPAGDEGYVTIEGWLPEGKQNALYVRREHAVPLYEVEGLGAKSSSYEAYRIFGVEAYEHFPEHVFDGVNGNYFQWEFRYEAQYEDLIVQNDKPMRTEKFVVNHLQGESRLVRYKFHLLDRHDRALATYEVEADEIRDEILVDSSIDFFGFGISIQEAIGRVPGITEIEADIFDTRSYAPLSLSQNRLTFPRPDDGTRAILELNFKLYPLEEILFEEAAHFELQQFRNPIDNSARVSVTLPTDATASDFAAAIEALDPLTKAEIVITGEIAFDTSPSDIVHPDLRLTGGGALKFSGDARLIGVGGGQLNVDSLTFDGGGITVRNQTNLYVSSATFRNFGTAVVADSSYALVRDSEFTDGDIAIDSTGYGVIVFDSSISGVLEGISTPKSYPLTIVGSDISASERVVDIRDEADYQSFVNLIANTSIPAHFLSYDEAPAAHSRESLIGENSPPYLGLPPGLFNADTRAFYGAGGADIRRRTGPTEVRLVKMDDHTVNCVLLSEREPWVLEGGSWLILQDSDAELRCQQANAGVAIPLPLAGAETWFGSIPATARIEIALEAPLENIDGVVESIPYSISVEKIGSGAPFPPVEGSDESLRQNVLVGKLVKAGDYAQAFGLAFDAHNNNPRDDEVSSTLVYAATSWTDAMEGAGRFDDAADLLTDLSDSDFPPGNIENFLIDSMAQHGEERQDARAWSEARELYRLILERSPTEEFATSNIRYTYQEEIRALFTPETADKTVSWIESEIEMYPDWREPLEEIAGITINNAVIDAMNSGDVVNGMALAEAHYNWSKTDRTLNNLQVGFQEYALDAIDRGDANAALDKYVDLVAKFGDGLELTSIASNVFGLAAQNSINAGDTENALSYANAFYSVSPTADAMNLIIFVYGRTIQSVSETEGAIPALAVAADAIRDFPDIARFKDEARTVGNNAGIAAYNAGDSATAVEIIVKTLELVPNNENLLANLKVIYANWAIDLANSGDLDGAERAAKGGLEYFPGDADLTNVVDYVARNR